MSTRHRSVRTHLNCTQFEAREMPSVTQVPVVAPAQDPAPVPAIENQSASSIINTTLNGFTYFVGFDADHGRELWRTNGTPEGTGLVSDLTPGTGSTDIRKIVVAGDKVVFAADTAGGTIGPELYSSDGTAAGTRTLVNTSIPSPSNPSVSLSVVAGLAAAGNEVLWGGFALDSNGNLRQGAFRTNVITEQTNSLEFGSVGDVDNSNNFVSLTGGVIFTARTTGLGRGLFATFTPPASDPPSPVTQRLLPDLVDNPIETVVKVSDTLAAVILPKGNGIFELWVTTVADTRQITVPAGTQLLGGLVAAGGKAYFTARAADGLDELWVTEGTDTSTIMLARVNPDTNDAPLRLLRTDGNKLYFPASNGVDGIEMWVSDGTVIGTKPITNLAPEADSSVDMYLQTANATIPQADGIAYFLANAGGTTNPDFRLYRTDGTAAGTYTIESGDTVGNLAVTSQFYLGQSSGTIYFQSGEVTPRLFAADGNSPTATATTTDVAVLLSFDEANNTINAKIGIAVRDASNHPVDGTVTVELNGTTYPAVTLDADGNGSISTTLSRSRLLEFLAAPITMRAVYAPFHPQQFRTSTASALGLLLFDNSILTVSDPVISTPATAGKAAQVTSQVTVNPALEFTFPGSVPLTINYEAVKSPNLTEVTSLGSRDFATGEVTFTTNPLPAAGSYFVRTNVVAPNGVLIRTNGAFVGIVDAPPATETQTTLVLSLQRNRGLFPNDIRYMMSTVAFVSATKIPAGQLEFVFNGEHQTVQVNKIGIASALFPVTDELLRDFIVNGTQEVTAEYLPRDRTLFTSSTATTRKIDGSELASLAPINVVPGTRVLISGEELRIFTLVINPSLSQELVPQTKVEVTYKQLANNKEIVGVLSPSGDGTVVVFNGPANFIPGDYQISLRLASADGNLSFDNAVTEKFSILAPRTAEGTTTSLVVRVRDINPITGATVDLTANVIGANGGHPAGNVTIHLGGITNVIPVKDDGTGKLLNQTIDRDTITELIQNKGSGITGDFIPDRPDEFVASSVSGGSVQLSDFLKFPAPVASPGQIVPGQIYSFSTTANILVAGVPIPMNGATVTFKLTGSSGLIKEAAVTVVNGVAQSPQFELPLTVALGDYQLVAFLSAGNVSLGTSETTVVKVIRDLGTKYPNILLAPKYTSGGIDSATAAIGSSRSELSINSFDSLGALSGLIDISKIKSVSLRGIAPMTGGDTIPDELYVADKGSPGVVFIRDGATGKIVRGLLPFEESFNDGVLVTTGDLNQDGQDEIVCTPDNGGSGRTVVYDPMTGERKADFYGIDDINFRGGARATIGLFELGLSLFVSAGNGGGPRIAGYDIAALINGQLERVFGDFYAFEETLRNGAYITSGDLNADGLSDLILGGGPDGGPRVLILDGLALRRNEFKPLANFYAGNESQRNGVKLKSTQLDGDAFADIVVGDPGTGLVTSVFLGKEILEGQTIPHDPIDFLGVPV